MLKKAIAEITSRDSVAEIMSQFEVCWFLSSSCIGNCLLVISGFIYIFVFQNAVNEERYHDASSLSRQSGSGLVFVLHL